MIKFNPYIFFPGNCREAATFYHEVFGGSVTIQTLGEAIGETDPAKKDRIMHADLTGGAVEFMASDSDRNEPYPPSFITLSIGGEDETLITALFKKLAEGGAVTSELKKEYWGDTFGTVTDKFGVDWMVNISGPKE